MRLDRRVVAILVAASVDPCTSFYQNGISYHGPQISRRPSKGTASASATVLDVSSTGVEDDIETTAAADNHDVGIKFDHLTDDIVSKLRFREVQQELERRDLDTSGTFTSMRKRLRQVATGASEIEGRSHDDNVIRDAKIRVIGEDALNDAFKNTGIAFQDDSDPDFDLKSSVDEILALCERVHWKSASRKFKKLIRQYGHDSANPRTIPEELFTEILQAYMKSRLHGARAAEPARRAMEEMVHNGYTVPTDIANTCIKESLGYEKDGTHEGFGGIDTALAMLTAVEFSKESLTPIFVDTYEKLITTLANEGSIDYALQMLREIVVDKADTPSLKVFADVASACVEGANEPEKLMTGLAYVKATGYELDNIASTVDGRGILAAGVIAAEKIGNIGLGLRFLTAASKAEGCEPDRGDTLVCNLSPASQRASTIIHRQAIVKAVESKNWKLTVKLLELMLERGLNPSPSVWRQVVDLCAKEKKSRRATSLLLDWMALYQQGRTNKPPLRIFNTVVNACEVCGEEELTIRVLDAMKKTHETEGNLITFNIALKRLAKQGSTVACEGMIIGMLQGGIEPSVVTYTTAVAACVAADPKRSDTAVEWIKRMKSRLVQPNVITYNTAFASCLDGTVEGTKRASQLASDMLIDVKTQINSGIVDRNDYTNIIPNYYTRTLAKELVKQFDTELKEGEIDDDVAESIRGPLYEMVDYLKSDLAELAERQEKFMKNEEKAVETDAAETDGDGNIEEEGDNDDNDDDELEYYSAISTHRAAVV